MVTSPSVRAGGCDKRMIQWNKIGIRDHSLTKVMLFLIGLYKCGLRPSTPNLTPALKTPSELWNTSVSTLHWSIHSHGSQQWYLSTNPPLPLGGASPLKPKSQELFAGFSKHYNDGLSSRTKRKCLQNTFAFLWNKTSKWRKWIMAGRSFLRPHDERSGWGRKASCHQQECLLVCEAPLLAPVSTVSSLYPELFPNIFLSFSNLLFDIQTKKVLHHGLVHSR